MLMLPCHIVNQHKVFYLTGATRSAGGGELMYARQKIVAVAKAYNAQAIDMVHIDYKGR